ncbi:MAG: glucosamine-6-phosphate deaminase [Silvibacterium sp.]|nr:glucosamine-6-phosphate deaminase [Silvibacterium sp.]
MFVLKDSSLDTIAIHIAESRQAMGAVAAADIAQEIRTCLQKQPGARMIFAAAPSQSDMLAALREGKAVDWSRVTAFHMDEYLGLPADAPQRFGLWLSRAIFDHLNFAAVHLIEPKDDSGDDPAHAASIYAAKLRTAPIDIVCCGIGTNGHLAFNDPPADFRDPLITKIVGLDSQCRQQQVDDRYFSTLHEVPTHAITITLPALLDAGAIFCTVPGLSKREVVRRAVNDPIGSACPATALRRHPRATLYLDPDSAGDLLGKIRLGQTMRVSRG